MRNPTEGSVSPAMRHKARHFAMQAVYQWQMTGQTPGQIEAQFLEEKQIEELWEINKNNGKKINSWNFEGLGENGGALIAWVDGYNIILFTSSQDGARIAFNKISLGRRGLYINEGTWSYSSKDLGVPQGLDYRDGYLYYLADAGKTVSDNPHIIYKIKLENNPAYTVSVLEEYHIDISDETEGLTIDPEGNIYFGTASEKIYKLDKPYNQLNKKQ